MSAKAKAKAKASVTRTAAPMGEDVDESTHWDVIKMMLESDESYVAKHHIQTYNYFVEKQIFDIFKNNNPVYFYKGKFETRAREPER